MRKIFSFFTDNGRLKLISLTISVFLFYVVRSDKDAEGTLMIDVDYINAPQEQVLLNELIPSVKLNIRGPWTGVRRLDGTTWPHKLVVDLSRVKADRYDLDSTLFQLPKGIRVTGITPQYLPIRMEQRMSRVVPVTIKVENNRNFLVTETSVDPAKIRLTGPKSVVLAYSAITLPSYTVDEDGAREFKVPLPDLPSNIEISPKINEFRIRIVAEKAIASRQFSHLTVTPRGYKGKVTFEPKTVDIVLEGPRKNLAALSAAQLIPVVELPTKPTEREFFAPVTLFKLPPEFHARIFPSQVRVRLP